MSNNTSKIKYIKSGLAVVVVALTAACAADDPAEIDGTPCEGKCDSIDPSEHLGALRLVVPDLLGVPLASGYEFRYRDKLLDLGTSYIFTAGQGYLEIKNASLGVFSRILVRFEIPSGTSIEYKLPVLELTWNKDAYATDLGEPALLRITRNGDDIARVSLGTDPTNLHDRALVVPAGDIRLEFSPDPLAAFSRSVVTAEGQTKVVDLAPATEKRGFVHFKPPVNIQIPTPTLNRCEAIVNQHWIVWTNSSVVREPVQGAPSASVGVREALPATAEQTFRMYQDTLHPYNYIVNNMRMELQVSPGGTLALQAEHVDINDVAIFPPNASGSTTAHATITIKDQNFIKFCNQTIDYSTYRAKTPFGLDVPPKAVQLTLQYETGAGTTNRLWTCRFDLPASPGVSRCTVTN